MDRQYWLETMRRIADPVLEALSERRLKRDMPVSNRHEYAHLEALGRLAAGMAPWLESGPATGEEGEARGKYAELVRQAIDAGTDPESPDRMNFEQGQQPLVDAAFLAHAIVRAPVELGKKLEPRVRGNVARALISTRTRKPAFCNWLLFAAMVETALYKLGEFWDPMRIDYALRQHEEWYLGDGVYGDGPLFHADYYNSYVIQPMLLDVLGTFGVMDPDWEKMKDAVKERSRRYAAFLESLIAPDGTYPLLGRSIVYRFGAFHLLAERALRHELGEGLNPTQVRCALTTVIRKTMETPGNFDDKGWLRIGVYGYQPELGEFYITTGSLYLCSTVFLPLGLPADDPFWQGSADWTSKRLWSVSN